MLRGIDARHHHAPPPPPPSRDGAAAPTERAAGTTTATAAAFHEQRSAELDFTTADGDTVTISASSTRDVAYASYDRKGQVSGTAVQASGEDTLSIQVDGSLDKEELRDIQKVLKFLRRAARDGEIDAREAKQLMRRDDLDSLSGVTAEFSVTRSAVAFAATA